MASAAAREHPANRQPVWHGDVSQCRTGGINCEMKALRVIPSDDRRPSSTCARDRRPAEHADGRAGGRHGPARPRPLHRVGAEDDQAGRGRGPGHRPHRSARPDLAAPAPGAVDRIIDHSLTGSPGNAAMPLVGGFHVSRKNRSVQAADHSTSAAAARTEDRPSNASAPHGQASRPNSIPARGFDRRRSNAQQRWRRRPLGPALRARRIESTRHTGYRQITRQRGRPRGRHGDFGAVRDLRSLLGSLTAPAQVASPSPSSNSICVSTRVTRSRVSTPTSRPPARASSFLPSLKSSVESRARLTPRRSA